MSCCCNDGELAAHAVPEPVAHSSARPSSWPRRIATLIKWAIPVTTLALLPKCPACVAAYALLFTGIGLSRPAATGMRWTLIALSLAALGYLLLRAVRRLVTTAVH
jgi:hypothetical protein